MDYEAPENFVEFKHGWYRGIDFDNEKKENDIPRT